MTNRQTDAGRIKVAIGTLAGTSDPATEGNCSYGTLKYIVTVKARYALRLVF